MRKIRLQVMVSLLIIIFIMTGCKGKNEEKSYSKDIFAMDTYMSVTGYGEKCEEAVNEAVAEIEKLDRLISIGNKNSEVSVINENGQGEMSEDTRYLVEHSIEYSKATDGAFDITVYPLMELWGFCDGNYRVPGEDEIKDTLYLTDYGKLSMNGSRLILGENQKIDLGGITKGYASSQIMKIFEKYNLESGLVYLGGNVQCYKRKTDGSLWTCAIQNPLQPQDSNSYLGIVKVEDRAVITSGGYERYFEEGNTKYHHIIDTNTGYPSDSGIISATIISKDGAMADAFSTAVYVMGKDRAYELWKNSRYDFDMIIMTENEKVYITQGLEDNFETDFGVEVFVR